MIIPEPYRIKVVQPIKMTTRAYRETALLNAGLNPFLLKADDVFIDLLTDSGTGAMSDQQWAGIMRGDESYAGSSSFYRLAEVVERLFHYQHTIPVHQGRGAEQILFPSLVERAKQRGASKPLFISNHHFDTTKAHVEIAGGITKNFICKAALDTSTYSDWKGNLDVAKLASEIEQSGAEQIAAVVITITCNSVGGQPVSMSNIQQVSTLARHHEIPVVIDAARFAENAYFIKQRDPLYADKSIHDIVAGMFVNGDIFTMSAKKDGLVNIGGLCCFKTDKTLFERVQRQCVIMEGFVTYGGLAGRDMEAMAIGLQEACDEEYLRSRIAQVEYLGEKLQRAGIPVQTPVGGHAVFVDASKVLSSVPSTFFPAQMLCNALYIESGVRATEIGSLMMGRNPVTREQEPALFELMRLTVPRRTYTNNHMDYVAESLVRLIEKAPQLRKLVFEYEPEVLRQFTARFKEI